MLWRELVERNLVTICLKELLTLLLCLALRLYAGLDELSCLLQMPISTDNCPSCHFCCRPITWKGTSHRAATFSNFVSSGGGTRHSSQATSAEKQWVSLPSPPLGPPRKLAISPHEASLAHNKRYDLPGTSSGRESECFSYDASWRVLEGHGVSNQRVINGRNKLRLEVNQTMDVALLWPCGPH